jgi:hypothetical protein
VGHATCNYQGAQGERPLPEVSAPNEAAGTVEFLLSSCSGSDFDDEDLFSIASEYFAVDLNSNDDTAPVVTTNEVSAPSEVAGAVEFRLSSCSGSDFEDDDLFSIASEYFVIDLSSDDDTAPVVTTNLVDFFSNTNPAPNNVSYPSEPSDHSNGISEDPPHGAHENMIAVQGAGMKSVSLVPSDQCTNDSAHPLDPSLWGGSRIQDKDLPRPCPGGGASDFAYSGTGCLALGEARITPTAGHHEASDCAYSGTVGGLSCGAVSPDARSPGKPSSSSSSAGTCVIQSQAEKEKNSELYYERGRAEKMDVQSQDGFQDSKLPADCLHPVGAVSMFDCGEADPFEELEAFLDEESEKPISQDDIPATGPDEISKHSSGLGSGSHVHNVKGKREGLVFFSAAVGKEPTKKLVTEAVPESVTDFATMPGTFPHTRADNFKQHALASKYVAKLGITHESINRISAGMSSMSSVSLLGGQGYVDTSANQTIDPQTADNKDVF